MLELCGSPGGVCASKHDRRAHSDACPSDHWLNRLLPCRRTKAVALLKGAGKQPLSVLKHGGVKAEVRVVA